MFGRAVSIIKKFSRFREIVSEHERLRAELSALQENPSFVPPGHYYSPIPSLSEIKKNESRIFGTVPSAIPGIELHEEEQLKLLEKFVEYYKEMPFDSKRKKGLRYFYQNPSYSYSDAIFLHCMIRFLQPNRIIEVGSGYSSCMTLDTNDLFFNGSIETTFIEPFPTLLNSLIEDSDESNSRILAKPLQDVELAEFETLQANDVLFIDSTHVSRVDSDVNYIFFEILPKLASGVYIHFHDIFYPFEYPKPWVYEGRAWTEIYLLRTFLQYNEKFRIVLMNTYLEHFHPKFFNENMPLCMKNRGGSIWIQKV